MTSFSQRRSTVGRIALRLEALEDRTLPSVATWTGAKDSSWSNPNNWREGFVPGAGDMAVFDDTATNLHATVDTYFNAGAVGTLVVTWHDPNAVIELARSVSVGTLQMSRGTITGPADLTIGGGFWKGGVWSASQVTILAGAHFTMNGSQLKVLECNVNNFGTTVWTGAGDIDSNSDNLTIFDNKPGATFKLANDAHWYQDGTAAFENEGTFLKKETTGTSTIDITFDNLKTSTVELLTGTVSITGGGKTVAPVTLAAGTVLEDSGDYTLDGAIISGEGVFEKTGAGQLFIVKSVLADSFELDGGMLGFIGNLEVRQGFAWTGGTIVSEVDIDPAATLTISGDATKIVKDNALINNSGAATWTGSGAIDLDGIFTNQNPATFDIQTDAEIDSLGNGRFNNLGTLLKSGGDGTTTFSILFTNAGLVEGLTGTLMLNKGWSLTGGDTNDNTILIDAGASVDVFDFTLDGTSVTGDGVLREVEGGQTNVVDDVSATNVELNDGVLATNMGDLTIDGTLTWTSGTITGSNGHTITIAGQGMLDIVGADPHLLSGTIINAGTASWFGTGSIYFVPGSQFTNQPGAVFLVEGSSDLTGMGTFQNQGLFQMDETPSTLIRIDITFASSGQLDLQSGTISLARPLATAGIISVGAGGTLSSQSPITIQPGGLLEGEGTIQADVVNGGDICPGGDSLAGTLTITGNYTQTATGTLNIKIGGPAEEDYDHLVVQGTVNLDAGGATLNVNLVAGFNPEVGQSFAVLTFSSLTGQFATINLPSFDGGQFDTQYLDTSLTLVAVPQ
jgi:hypothetical protein